MKAVQEMTLRPADEVAAVTTESQSLVTVLERLARDPAVDVDKMDRLMQMHERATARLAQEQFNAAMAAAQTDMRPVRADADNPQTRSKYASYNALDRALRPIYTTHGFGLSFDTGDGAAVGWIRVLCYVTHVGGFSRTYKIDMPADGKGAKGGDVMTLTHAVGAGSSYGMRYLLKMIFNVAIGEDDRDGNDPPTTKEPDGFSDWFLDLEAVAENGLPALEKAWKASPASLKEYAAKHCRQSWEATKKKAAKVVA